jgi:hypothetical protein
VWSQILRLRNPLDKSRDIEPHLANRLMEIYRLKHQLYEEWASDRKLRTMEEQGVRYRALTTEWGSLLGQIRSIPTFKNFSKSPKSSQLLQAAQSGPIIVLNIADERCDALALVPGLEEIVHIPLPNMTSKRVTELREELKGLLSSNGLRVRGERAAKRVEDVAGDEEFKCILAELWNGLVKPILGSLAFPVRLSIIYNAGY